MELDYLPQGMAFWSGQNRAFIWEAGSGRRNPLFEMGTN